MPFVLLALAACEATETPSPIEPEPVAPPPPDVATVGPAGGTVTADDGSATITIPPGALTTEVAITVVPDTAAAAATPTVGAAYRFEPTATAFAEPARIRLTWSGGGFRSGTDLSALRVARWSDPQWVPLETLPAVDVAARWAEAQVEALELWGLWADPCLPRTLASLNQALDEVLVVEDCSRAAGDYEGPSQYFGFSVDAPTAIDVAWSGDVALAVGLKQANDDPTQGTIWGHTDSRVASGSAQTSATSLPVIVPVGDYQLFVSGEDSAQVGPYELDVRAGPICAANQGRPCGMGVVLVPGTRVSGARVDAAEGDCPTTTGASAVPGWSGQAALVDAYRVRLLPERAYSLHVRNPDEGPPPQLTMAVGGELRRQSIASDGSSYTIEVTTTEATSFDLQVLSTAPPGSQPPALPYELSVFEAAESSEPNLVPEHEAAEERDDGTGAFRTHCLESHQAFDDPLVAPGQPGTAHHHVFMGNPTVDAYSTVETLQWAKRTTCDGGTLNRSAYWVPALFGADGERIEYVDPLIYYKTGYHLPVESIVAPPAGLRIIAGNAHAMAPQDVAVVKFRCASWTTDEPQFEPGDPLDHVPYLPDCALDDIVEMRLVFPQCWDGVNLTAPDHQSHMAYPSEAVAPVPGTGSCPASHPIAIPEISYNFHVYVTDETGPPPTWRFASAMNAAAPAGTSFHGDWMNGWDEPTMQTIVENCLNRALECGVGLLGNGMRLRPVVFD